MLETVKLTNVYNSLGLNKKLNHAYLFYSNDQAFNNEIALTFARSILCKNHTSCGKCDACLQFISKSHPDFFLINNKSVKVEDVSKMLDKMSTLPVSADYKVFVVLDAENINERAQNKMLKSLEEPNEKNIFIMTTSKLDKVLPTILSRLNKVRVPNLSVNDKKLIIDELKKQNIDLQQYKNFETLTEMLNFVDGKTLDTLHSITKIFDNLNTTADIPNIVNSIGDIDKEIFFPLMQEMFLSALQHTDKFDKKDIASIALRFSPNVIVKCLPLIDDAYKKLKANVNFAYILDNLLFNMLKEKFYAINWNTIV